MASTPYDKYISRLQKQKLGEAQNANFARGVQALTSTNQYVSDMSSGMRLGNVSASARAASLQQALKGTGDQLSNLTLGKMEQAQQRSDKLNTAIGELETQREQYLKQQDQAEKQKKRGLLQAAGQIAGAGIGALLAAPTGGMSMALGAALGSALGGTAGSLINAGLPQDYAAAAQGVGDAFSAYSSYANETKTKDAMKAVSGQMSKIANLPYSKMSMAFNTINMMISQGANAEEITKAIDGFAGNQLDVSEVRQQVENYNLKQPSYLDTVGTPEGVFPLQDWTRG